jgi:hypothetical protein
MKSGFQLQLIFILLLVFFTSCGKSKQEFFDGSVTFRYDTVDLKHLTNGKILELTPPIRISRFRTHDTLLIASGKSGENDFGLHIYSLNSGKHICSFALMGRGPDENLNIFDFQLLPESKKLYYFDSQARRARVYSIEKVLTNSKVGPEETIRFGKSVFDGILRLGDRDFLCRKSLIGPTLDDRVMLSKVTLPDYIIEAEKHFPSYHSIPTKVWYSQLYDIFYMNYSFNTANGFLVLSYYWTDLLEVYDINLNRRAIVHGPEGFLPVFGFSPPHPSSGRQGDNPETLSKMPQSPMDNVIRPKGVARIGYELCFAAKNGFYVSYNGAHSGGSIRSFPESIYLFRYDGTPVCRYTFSTGGFGLFNINESEEKIYLINNLGEMMVYNLNEY